MEENSTRELVINIIPSKPFKNYEEIGVLAAPAAGRVERIQVDICDGEYVRAVSWPFTGTGKVDFAKLKDKPELDVYMPQWEELNYTADLMCLNPEKYIETLVAYGFDEIIVHFRSLRDQDQLETILQMCEKYDLRLYLAVDMTSNFSEFMHTLKGVFDSRHPNFVGVQVMGIENIGLQHQDFVPKTLEMVKKIRAEFPEIKILFDGGITDENLLDIKQHGVDVFCIGHLLTDGDFKENLRNVKRVILG